MEMNAIWYRSRFLNMLSSLAYIGAFSYIYQNFLSAEYFVSAGMNFRYLTPYEHFTVYFLCGVIGWSIPPSIDRASSIIIWFIFIFYTSPALLLTFHMGMYKASYYYGAIISLSISLIFISIATQYGYRKGGKSPVIPGERMIFYVLIIWGLSTVVLVAAFWSILSFSGIDDIYHQRALARDSGGGALLSYIRTYYCYLLNPLLISIGFITKRRMLIVAGIAGSVLTYMIDAQKVAFLLVIGMFGFYYVLKRGISATWIFTLSMAIFCFLASLVTEYSPLSRYFADVVLLRAVAIPGGTFVQYYDLFSGNGYTYWSNIRGLNLLIPPPAAYAQDADWPALGVIVGRAYFPWVEGLNHSASAFSGEGAAAAGSIGILVIGFVLAIFLRVLDKASKRWNQLFVIVALVPIAMALANAHLSNVLLSFGGAAWILIFHFYRPARRRQAISPSAMTGDMV